MKRFRSYRTALRGLRGLGGKSPCVSYRFKGGYREICRGANGKIIGTKKRTDKPTTKAFRKGKKCCPKGAHMSKKRCYKKGINKKTGHSFRRFVKKVRCK